jgi:predicted cupin superfamily sugar epimerase
MTAADWLAKLDLLPHPEGGYYRETYRAPLALPASGLPDHYAGPRAASTAIYFLLPGDTFSAFHRVRSDEVWHYYAGSSATLHLLEAAGRLHTAGLGLDAARGQQPQLVVPAGTWFAVTVDRADDYLLAGCTVAPGFAFADFELAAREELAAAYPQHRAIIHRLTRGTSP